MKRQLTKHFWVDDEKRTGAARLIAPLQILSQPRPGDPKPVAEASQFKNGWFEKTSATEEITPLAPEQILPREADLYYLTMRAISQKVLEGHWVDYTRAGVLEASAALLNGQRICVDHCYWKVEDAVGAIVSSAWDAEGANSNGTPGVNIRFFVDSKIAPGIVRRLAYPVPAIHSGSVTVGFEWDPSHPQLLEDGKFWWLLGEDVDGDLVRLIANRILFYREFSLVYEGADSDAKRLPHGDDDDIGEDDDDQLKRKQMYAASNNRPPEGGKTNEVKTVKLTAEQKKLLGLEAHASDEVPDADVLTALQIQGPKLSAAQSIIQAERIEVIRLATLAEGKDGNLSDAFKAMILAAAPDQLPELKKLYAERAQEKFPQTCQKCGASQVAGRSSVEEPVTQQSQAAGQTGAKAERIPFL